MGTITQQQIGTEICTIFENIFSRNPFHTTVDKALERIRTGASKARIEEIRRTLDKEKAKSLKALLPSVRFSGRFTSWTDESLVTHSGFMVLDFDDVDVEVKMPEVVEKEYVYSAWLSPSGTGIKALVRIADGKKHREHFEAMKDEWPDEEKKSKTQIDRSGINVSRICYESYDPHIYINPDAVPFTKTKIVEKIETKEVVEDEQKIFVNILKWLTNRGDAFVKGERNHFLFKLAAACCRFGLGYDTAESLILKEFKPAGGDCKIKGYTDPIKNAYKANKHRAGSAKFEKEVLVDKVTRKEVDVQQEFEEVDGDRLTDVIYGIDVKEQAFRLYDFGYENIKGLGIPELDTYWKPWKKEMTLLSGIGNYGKSAFAKWYFVFRTVLFGEKFALFAPEDKRDIFYHELTEVLLGEDLTAHNKDRRSSREEYNNAYDFISAHFFYIYPKTLAPTPSYIKEKFLELIIKEGVDWCIIDPFNQLSNDYGKVGNRDDKYLEVVLADFDRFAELNNIFFYIIAHPTKSSKDSTGNYPCPDVFDMAGGAMWNNKMENITIYHRPFAQTDPNNPACEFHSKKIKDQKVVGIKGFVEFELCRPKRRFLFGGRDHLAFAIMDKQLNFKNPVPVQGRLM